MLFRSAGPILNGISLMPMFHLIGSGATDLSAALGYFPREMGLLLVSQAATLLLTLLGVYAAYLYFKKDKKFPGLYIGILVSAMVISVLDFAVATSLLGSEAADLASVSRTWFWGLVWILYLLQSKRVRATFYNEDESDADTAPVVPAAA